MEERDKLSNFVRDWFRSRSGDAALTLAENTSLVGEHVDSLGFLELAAAIEHEFGIELDFSEGDPESFVTFGGFVTLCDQQRAGVAP